ncbi:MAG: TetR/AcrR family transcriptional regulator [Methanoregula sp.]|jgi:AcrR family transcriptional regulator
MMKKTEKKRSGPRKPATVPDDDDKKSSDNREKILATALTLFTERGFFGTPTSLISKEAGVATGTLFFYFTTKEELIDTLYRRIKSEAAQVMCRDVNPEKTALAKLRRIGFNAVEWGIQNPAKQKFMEQFAHSPFVSTNAHEEGMSHFLFLQDIVKDGIRVGTIRTIDPGLLFCMMASSLSGLIARAYAEHDPARREKIVNEGLDYIFAGMKAEKGT